MAGEVLVASWRRHRESPRRAEPGAAQARPQPSAGRDEAAEGVYRALDRHVREHWQALEVTYYRPPASRLADALESYRIAEVRPGHPDAPWLYVTLGAWQAPHRPGKGEEFFLLAPEPDRRHVRTLDLVATFHFESAYPLEAGSTLNLGRPWLGGAAADHVYLSPAYPIAPEARVCAVDGGEVTLLWLVPITDREVDHRYRVDAPTFESLLESEHIDVIDPSRSELV